MNNKPKKRIEDIVRRQRIIQRVIAVLGFVIGMGLGLWILIEIVKIGIQR
jgi:hypothetical protein